MLLRLLLVSAGRLLSFEDFEDAGIMGRGRRDGSWARELLCESKESSRASAEKSWPSELFNVGISSILERHRWEEYPNDS